MISSDGISASDVTKTLKDIGFKTNLGSHDYYFDWDEGNVLPDDVIGFVDTVQKKLKGMNVRFSITTLD